MIFRLFRHLLVSLPLVLTCHGADPAVIPYRFPPEFPVSSFYQVTASGVALPAMQTKRGAFLSFGMSGPVELVVKVEKAPEGVVVRPLSAGVRAAVDGRTIRFRLPRPMNLSVELDGDLGDPLLVFANPALPDPPGGTPHPEGIPRELFAI